jgi:FkbM family methyltransferase
MRYSGRRVLDILRHRLRYARRGGFFGLDPTLRWLDRLSLRFEMAIDIGAYHGLFSRALAKKSAAVLAIEPRSVDVVHMATVLPGHCRPMCFALSDRVGPLHLSTPLRQGRPDFALTFARRPTTSHWPTYDWSAQGTTLDRLLEDGFSGQKIGFVKMDVEGHELAIIRGAAATIAMHRPILLVEAESRHGCDVDAVFDILSNTGYLAVLPWRNNEQSLSAQDFLRLQAMSDPDRWDYVNNVLFVPMEHCLIA